MKKNIILAIFFGIASLYAFSTNPNDPPAKSGFVLSTNVVQQLPFVSEDCLLSIVTVDVRISFLDCPFKCLAPCANLYINLTDGNGTVYGYQQWNGNCFYVFTNLRIEELTMVYAEFYNPFGCTPVWKNQPSTSLPVPIGGGNITCNMYYCP